MKTLIRTIAFLLIAFNPFLLFSQNLPKVYIVATGGTIAGSASENVTTTYKAGDLKVEDIIASVSGIEKIANLETVQFANIGSQNMSSDILIDLAEYLNTLLKKDDVSGAVITHGTDTMEESAYFLSLTINSPKPVVLVGAMRPSTSLSADGPANIYSAVKVATSPESKDRGVLVVMNDNIFLAKDVAKMHTHSTDAFAAQSGSIAGVVASGEVKYLQPKIKSPEIIKLPSNLPKVAILYGHVDADPSLVDFLVKQGYKGIVYAGVGHGNMNDSTLDALYLASKNGIAIVRSSRVPYGLVTSKGEVDDDKYGFTSTQALNPPKARLLLALALSEANGDKVKALQIFDKLK